MRKIWGFKRLNQARNLLELTLSFICLTLTRFVVIFHHLINIFYTLTPRFLSTLLEYNYTLEYTLKV